MRVRWLAAVVLMLAIVVCAGCGTAVPDVKGKTPQQAADTLSATGFKTGKVSWDPSGTGAKGAVIAQDPAAGRRVSAGAVVNLTVAGAAPVAVPSLAGMTREGALAALAIVGLVPGQVWEANSTTAASGTVLNQDPAAGTTVTAGYAVGFVLGRGPMPAVTVPGTPAATPAPVKVKVPPVKGLTLAVAQTKISAAGLKYKHVLGPGDGKTDVGFAYKQLPAAGTSVSKGTVVTAYSWSWK